MTGRASHKRSPAAANDARDPLQDALRGPLSALPADGAPHGRARRRPRTRDRARRPRRQPRAIFDPWVLGVITERPIRYLAKAELWRYPVLRSVDDTASARSRSSAAAVTSVAMRTRGGVPARRRGRSASSPPVDDAGANGRHASTRRVRRARSFRLGGSARPREASGTTRHPLPGLPGRDGWRRFRRSASSRLAPRLPRARRVDLPSSMDGAGRLGGVASVALWGIVVYSGAHVARPKAPANAPRRVRAHNR